MSISSSVRYRATEGTPLSIVESPGNAIIHRAQVFEIVILGRSLFSRLHFKGSNSDVEELMMEVVAGLVDFANEDIISGLTNAS